MAFALAVTNLIDAMKKPGCPVCRLSDKAAERALESFLWENVNEPDVRQGIIDSYGFCPAHTRLMVAQELSTSSAVLGTNIIYEHLGRIVAGELRSLRLSEQNFSGGIQGWLRKLGIIKGERGPLAPRGICPVCEAGNNAAQNGLHVLCEEMDKEGDVRAAYLSSDGLCLPYLRMAIMDNAGRYPTAVQLIIDDMAERLTRQSAHMKEYIRKNNWSYRDEKLTEKEDTAWRKTLTSFTGYPGSKFIYKVDDD